MKFVGHGSALLFVFVLGCAAESTPPPMPGNGVLGIASFETHDDPYETIVVGRNAAGDEVARMDLVHGRFTLNDFFRDGYDTPDVDGRDLVVSVGQHRFTYQVGDYDAHMHMPAHPSSEWKIAAFLADPHVKPMLDTWKLGWESESALDSEDGYTWTTGSLSGTNGFSCDGLSQCGNANTCGATTAATTAGRITIDASEHGYDKIAQCCPGAAPFFATKKCMTDYLNDPNDCATGSQNKGTACRGCGQYDSDGQCVVSSSSSSISWNFDFNPMTIWVSGEISGEHGSGYGPGSYIDLYGGEYVTVTISDPHGDEFASDSGVWSGNVMTFFFQGQQQLTIWDMTESLSATYFLY